MRWRVPVRKCRDTGKIKEYITFNEVTFLIPADIYLCTNLLFFCDI